MSNHKKVEYIPPADETINDYARRVCEALDIEDRQVRYGFANYLKFASKILAKQMTEKHNKDTKQD